MRKDDINSKKRIIIVMLVFAVSIIYVVGFLVHWQLFKGDELQKKAIAQQTQESTISSDRGVIYDRNGKILAQNSSVETVTACPKDVKKANKVDETAQALAEILNLDAEDLKKKLSQDIEYVEIKKKVDIETTNLIREKNLTGVFWWTTQSAITRTALLLLT